eukprot:scaffold8130_cov69-Phaeocystis_antarctica.AAC.9
MHAAAPDQSSPCRSRRSRQERRCSRPGRPAASHAAPRMPAAAVVISWKPRDARPCAGRPCAGRCCSRPSCCEGSSRWPTWIDRAAPVLLLQFVRFRRRLLVAFKGDVLARAYDRAAESWHISSRSEQRPSLGVFSSLYFDGAHPSSAGVTSRGLRTSNAGGLSAGNSHIEAVNSLPKGQYSRALQQRSANWCTSQSQLLSN